MAKSPQKLEFFYDGNAVGYFEEVSYPGAPGRYRFMQYRGPGHLYMQQARHAGNRPRCTFQTDDRIDSFAVDDFVPNDSGSSRVLELSEFEIKMK